MSACSDISVDNGAFIQWVWILFHIFQLILYFLAIFFFFFLPRLAGEMDTDAQTPTFNHPAPLLSTPPRNLFSVCQTI